MAHLTHWIETNLPAVITLAVVMGLTLPVDFHAVPPIVVPLLIAINFFFASSKITLRDYNFSALWGLLPFLLIRYVGLPVAFFYCARGLVPPDMLLVALLIILAPVGVTAPPVTIVNHGSVTLTMMALLLTSAATPFLLPSMVEIMAGTHLPVSFWTLIASTGAMIFLPYLVMNALRPIAPRLRPFLVRNVAWVSITLIAITIVIIVGQQRHLLFDSWDHMGFLALSVPLYALMYLIGWVWPSAAHDKQHRYADRLALASASGVNNIALILALVILYFPAPAPLYAALGHLTWCLGVTLFQMFLYRSPPSTRVS